jgi:cob(I)alamin adenosyltransferase
MKIYTKNGDNGYTSLYDGTKVKKNYELLCSVGTIDELSSNIGMLIVLTNDEILNNFLRCIQRDLQYINSLIATPSEEKRSRLIHLNESNVSSLEKQIDDMESFNDRLTQFILPGVTMVDAQCHICRTICRRVERDIIDIDLNDNIVNKYINRLSDYFFVLARYLCKKSGFSDFKIIDIKN